MWLSKPPNTGDFCIGFPVLGDEETSKRQAA